MQVSIRTIYIDTDIINMAEVHQKVLKGCDLVLRMGFPPVSIFSHGH